MPHLQLWLYISIYTPPLPHSPSPFLYLQPRRLECIQLMYYVLHRLLSSSAILSKQWFLITLPNNDTTFIVVSIIVWFVMSSCRYNDTDGVGIDTCGRYLGCGEDLLDAGDGGITFLGSPVSVSWLCKCMNDVDMMQYNMNKMRQWLVR